MKITPVIPNSLGQGASTVATQLIHAEEKEQWLQSLTAGQILKGRVMRSYGDSRFGVSFAGQERIVDSTIPLTVGETLHGKVVGISEKNVSLQVLSKSQRAQSDGSHANPKPSFVLDQDSVSRVMNESRVTLTQAQRNVILSATQGSEMPELAAKVGVFLVKVGLPITKDLIRLMTMRVVESQDFDGRNISEDVPSLVAVSKPESSDSIDQVATIQTIADFFNNQHIQDLEVERKQQPIGSSLEVAIADTQVDLNVSDGNLSDQNSSFAKELNAYLRLMLNVQTGASTQHRFQSLPIIINGRMIEFDLALFDHTSVMDSNHNELKSRHLKFSLSTEFGEVTLDAHVLDHRLHLKVSTSSTWLTKEMEMSETDLSHNLSALGWLLESTEYQVSDSPENYPAAHVINHVLSQDSLRVVL